MKDLGADRIVVVGGSAEARALAAAMPGAHVRLPLPERLASGASGVASVGPVTAEWLSGLGARAVVIAPHPCDAATARAARDAAHRAGCDVALLRRLPWRAGPRDRWLRLRAARDAARHIPPGDRVLVTLGRDALRELRALRATSFVRRIGPADGPCPLRRGRFLAQEGPFDVAGEVALLRRLRIGWILTRNAGGAGGWPKLAAARALGLRVALLDRPHWPAGRMFTDTEGAARWAMQRISAG